MNKRYFWIKLREDFFKSMQMKKLRKIAGGDTYTIIYLKMQLLSINEEGRIYFQGIEPTIHEELALALDEEPDNVQTTLLFLESAGLLRKESETEYLLTEVPHILGSESDSAERVRRFREKKALQCNTNVTECNALGNKNVTLDIDIDIDKEKEKDIEKIKRGKSKFSPPTIEEVRAYCFERGNNVDSERFIDYYSSNGWMVGRNKMKDWKAAVRTWEKNGFEKKDKFSEELDMMEKWKNGG